jgi:hypothetical protein
MKKQKFLNGLATTFIVLLIGLFLFLGVGLLYENMGGEWGPTLIGVAIIIIILGGIWGIAWKL